MISKRYPQARYYTRKLELHYKIKCEVCAAEIKMGDKYFSTSTRREWHEACDTVDKEKVA